MIYIDPPYNTGNDFVYNDDFAESADEYLANSGQFDAEGNRLVQNTESNGRYHTDWLNMIYSRLKLAKDLLSDDGIIFISIDDNEIDNLLKISNEIFGKENMIANFIWHQGRKSAAKMVAINHEYCIVYCKSFSKLMEYANSENSKLFLEKKKGLDEIYAKVDELKMLYGTDYEKISSELKKFYKSYDKDSDVGSNKHYCNVDDKGIYFAADASAPDNPANRSHKPLIHPVTGKPTAVPKMGWRYNEKTLERLVNEGRFHFGKDETIIPCVKRYLHETSYINTESVFYKDGRGASLRLANLFGKKVFDFPKDELIIKNFISFIDDKDAYVLDFFSGSATTAHAVMQLNAEDGGNRKFIMVQLPEETDGKSEAYKAGYNNICEIGKERIRRAGTKIKEESPMTTTDLDVGFRVLKLDSSNMKDVYYNPADYELSLFDNLADNIKEDRTPEDLLFQVMLDLGVLLSSKIEESTIGGKKVFNVADGFLYACFDENVTEDVITEIAKKQPYYFVMRDSSMANDSVATNFEQIFATYSPDTVRKVL